MRFVLFTAALATAACSSTKLPPGCTSADSQAFPTFQACFDEHTQMESFTPARAIEICCIDHPIGSAALVLPFVAATATSARADHHDTSSHDAPSEDEPRYGTFGGSVALVAASYQTQYYGGDYEGAIVGGSWAYRRFSVGASLGSYRLLKNGLEQFGIGDAVANAQATIVATRDARVGVVVALSLPTAAYMSGLGMDHAMAMPAAYGAWKHGRVALAATFGYSRALVSVADVAQHDHGPWPLVEPMNMSELTWSGSGEVALGRGVRCGARLLGGIPIGAMPGHERVVAAARVAWATGRVDTTAELQGGVVGDPFSIRGVVSTALRF